MLSEQAFLVLTSLAAEARHGYAVMQDVAELSAGRVSLRAGTLYGVLDRLSADGLVEPDHDEVVDGRLRRYYRVTDGGRATLAAEVERMRHNARVAARRLRETRTA